MKSGFKHGVNWDIYQSKVTTCFKAVFRLLKLVQVFEERIEFSFENNANQKSYKLLKILSHNCKN